MSRTQLLKSNGSPLYVQVSDLLTNWMTNGTYAVGSKVPSVREMSRKLDVSISTVIQSYNFLESKGLLEARPQSGYYVRGQAIGPIPSVSRPAAAPRFVQSNDAYLDVIRSCGADDILQLGSAKIDVALLPVDALNKSLSKMARDFGSQAVNYDQIAGFWKLRQVLARRSIDAGLEVEQDRVITATGCMEAIQLALRAVTKAGDTVAVESPTYYGILHALQSAGLKVLELPTSAETGVDLDVFEEKLKRFPIRAAVITPSFQNPLGFLMPDENKLRLLQLCQKYEVELIEDDIYADLSYEGQRPSAIKSFDKKDRVFLCSSFSKTLTPGYRIGWIIPPKKYREEIERLKFSFTVASATPTQMAIADFLETYNYDRHLRKLRQTLSQNSHFMRNAICESFPAETFVTKPSGGCLLWVELPKKVNALELHSKALNQGISIIPGVLFSSNSKYTNFARINCGIRWTSKVENGLHKVGEIAKKLI